ncbi:MO2R4 protein, partial [Scytalopus superciliaris]|nr:MO2R4 protein [Scytalopus superciliaris]
VCSATGKPAPSITWLDGRGLDESPELLHIQNANGTVTVASRLTFSANHHHALSCLLEHPQGMQTKALHLEEEGGEGVQKIIIITVVVTAVLILLVLTLNNRRKKQKRLSAPRTPAKETGLYQELGEKASVSLHTPKDQHVCQNE